MAIRSNRTIAVSEEDKKQGKFCRIDSFQWSSQELVRGWLKGLDFPVLLHRQVFTNKDGSICEAVSFRTGILYLACSDFNCNLTQLVVMGVNIDTISKLDL